MSPQTSKDPLIESEITADEELTQFQEDVVNERNTNSDGNDSEFANVELDSVLFLLAASESDFHKPLRSINKLFEGIQERFDFQQVLFEVINHDVFKDVLFILNNNLDNEEAYLEASDFLIHLSLAEGDLHSSLIHQGIIELIFSLCEEGGIENMLSALLNLSSQMNKDDKMLILDSSDKLKLLLLLLEKQTCNLEVLTAIWGNLVVYDHPSTHALVSKILDLKLLQCTENAEIQMNTLEILYGFWSSKKYIDAKLWDGAIIRNLMTLSLQIFFRKNLSAHTKNKLISLILNCLTELTHLQVACEVSRIHDNFSYFLITEFIYHKDYKLSSSAFQLAKAMLSIGFLQRVCVLPGVLEKMKNFGYPPICDAENISSIAYKVRSLMFKIFHLVKKEEKGFIKALLSIKSQLPHDVYERFSEVRTQENFDDYVLWLDSLVEYPKTSLTHILRDLSKG